MRWFLGLLVLVNLAILLWGGLSEEKTGDGQLAMPDVGSIRLVGEARNVQAPVAVPIPAPPRSDGVMVKPAALPSPSTEPAAVASATEPDAAPEVSQAESAEPAPLAEAPSVPEPATPEPAAVTAETVAEPAAPPAAPVAAKQPARPRFCSRIGPFTDAKSARSVQKYLEGRGGKVATTEETLSMRAGYWVLVPPLADQAAAKAVATKLTQKGIKDYWVMSKGEYQNGISLGVFSQEDNAKAFAKRVTAKGFNVILTERLKERTVQWLDYQGDVFIPPMEIRARAPEGVKVEDRDCP